jgi:hypothetical protein
MTIHIDLAGEAGICQVRFSGTISAADIEHAVRACLEAAARRPIAVLLDFAADALGADVLSWLFYSADYHALLDHPNLRAGACVVYSMMAWLTAQAFAWPVGIEVFNDADEAYSYLVIALSGGAQPSFSG